MITCFDLPDHDSPEMLSLQQAAKPKTSFITYRDTNKEVNDYQQKYR